MLTVQEGVAFEAGAYPFPTGLVGTIGVTIVDNDGATTTPRSTAGIIEYPAGSGFYQANLTAPATAGQYSIVWDSGVVSPSTVAAEDLLVVTAEEAADLPVVTPGDDSEIVGPCSAWADADDVADCCSVATGTEPEAVPSDLLDTLALEASRVLYALSGRLFAGDCIRTVRPCRGVCGCGWQTLSRGHIVWADRGWLAESRVVGCGVEESVTLAGYPVREISEVLIDGAVVDPTTYRLVRHRELQRLSPHGWPACQNLAKDDDEEGTWSVTYRYGQNPPALGTRAAAALACQLVLACGPGSAECFIPEGVTRVTRQGIEVERKLLADFLVGGKTGIYQVDAFLAAYNPSGLTRRPAVYSPDLSYPMPVPAEGSS